MTTDLSALDQKRSLEGRGQASGEADDRNLKLASLRGKYMRDVS